MIDKTAVANHENSTLVSELTEEFYKGFDAVCTNDGYWLGGDLNIRYAFMGFSRNGPYPAYQSGKPSLDWLKKEYGNGKAVTLEDELCDLCEGRGYLPLTIPQVVTLVKNSMKVDNPECPECGGTGKVLKTNGPSQNI